MAQPPPAPPAAAPDIPPPVPANIPSATGAPPLAPDGEGERQWGSGDSARSFARVRLITVSRY